MVSILIPVYNREALIEETVHSALNQTYKDIEIIIVDNKSTDATWDVLTRLAAANNKIKIFQNTENIGPVKNWMRCINEASGEYAKILWSDDLIAPTFIERTLPFLEKNNNIGFVFTGTEIFYEESIKKINAYFIGRTNIYQSEKYISGILENSGFPVSPGCAIFRLKDLSKNLLINIPNKVDSDFTMHAIGNDLLIFLLTANDYEKFAFVNEKLSFFRAHKDSISIQSDNGKLPLHYMLVKAYFVENFRSQFIHKLNTQILFLIKFYNNNGYKLNQLSSFYMENKDYRISYIEIFSKLLNIRVLKKVILILFTKVIKNDK